MPNLQNLKHVIAIASGKGGVGKSTVAVNLSLALKKSGYKVGLLDADLYGPSLPLLLGISNEMIVQHDVGKNMEPIMAYDMPTMSIGYLIDERAPAIWRGPIASKAIQQLFYSTQWGELDYLIVDLPPGTGDIHLTLAQKLNLEGVVMVTTPQNIALADVRKAMAMFQKLAVPLLGVVENMTIYQCIQCGHTARLFGEEGGLTLSKEYHTILLGALPLDERIREQSDKGKPLVLMNFETPTSEIYYQISKNLVSLLKTKKMRRFPDVVVE